MRVVIIFLAILGYCSTLSSIDWDKIQPINVYIKPKNNVSAPILPRIIGGTEAEPHSRPYQAAIVIDSTLFCGGTLISPFYILTAAHCLEGHAYFQIILGAHNIRIEETSQVVVTSVTAIVHPAYNPRNLNNDIGLIRLPYRVVSNEYIQTIPLAPEGSGDFPTLYLFVSGWGRVAENSTGLTTYLQEVKVAVIANWICTLYFDDDIIIESTICTSAFIGIGGPCDGDSGGPLVLDNMLMGVVSFTSSSGCEDFSPSGYARVSSFWRWITENTDLGQ